MFWIALNYNANYDYKINLNHTTHKPTRLLGRYSYTVQQNEILMY